MMYLYVSDFSMISSACRITKQNCGIYHIVFYFSTILVCQLINDICGMRFVF